MTDVDNCCVLRLDPNADTVSVIAEIILANNVILVETVLDVDIVYYNETTVTPSSNFLKVYFQGSWLSFNQTQECIGTNCSNQTYPFQLMFSSVAYNFGSVFDSSITFILNSSVILNSNQNAQNPILKLISPQQSNYKMAEYSGRWELNFNEICGSIMKYYQQVSQNVTMSIFTIETDEVITKNKIISSTKY